VGIATHRDKFVISYKEDELKRRIEQIKSSSLSDEIIAQTYNLKDKSHWNIQSARKKIKDLDNYSIYIKKILYRPFDNRYIFYHESLIDRMRFSVMQNMLKENIGLTIGRAGSVVGLEQLWNLVFITTNLIDLNLYYRGGELLFPLYVYPNIQKKNLFNHHKTEKEPNISPQIFNKLEEYYKRIPTPEEILYYIYGIFYSNIYRETYAEFLKIDFPRVPFTADENLFCEMGN